jgi:hypothetical protein
MTLKHSALLALMSLAPMADKPDTSNWFDALQTVRHADTNSHDTMATAPPDCGDPMETPTWVDVTSDT